MHREQVTRILQQQPDPQSKSLAILGAGNGNDFHLDALAQRYQSITLFDIDPDALRRCVGPLPEPLRRCVKTVAPIDLTGVLDRLMVADKMPSEAFDELVALAANPEHDGASQFDVVASTCLLSQLIDSVHQAIPESHPQRNELVMAIRDGHLNLIRQWTKPEGQIVLISDFVSSDSWPELPNLDGDSFLTAVQRTIQEGNFFTGLNPGALIQQLAPPSDQKHPMPQIHAPWRWQMGPRYFAVFCVEIRKSP